MVIQCPGCGMQRIVPDALYGRPLFCCGGCGTKYLTDKITEPALGSGSPARKKKQSILIDLALLWGVFLLLDGLTASGPGGWILLAYGLIFTAGPLIVFFGARRDRLKQATLYQEAVNQSEERLKNPLYQAALLSANNVTREFRQSLDAFNEAHGTARYYSEPLSEQK